jgi:hypothetical protein
VSRSLKKFLYIFKVYNTIFDIYIYVHIYLCIYSEMITTVKLINISIIVIGSLRLCLQAKSSAS